MTVKDKILRLLNKAGVQYRTVEHEPVYTSEEAARIRDTKENMGAKALVCFADKKPILIVVPGNMKVDFKKFKSTFNINDLHLASPQKVTELTSLEVGAIPPVGTVMNIPSYYDVHIENSEDVAFNAGSHTFSVVMKTEDLLNIENPTFGNFACLKK